MKPRLIMFLTCNVVGVANKFVPTDGWRAVAVIVVFYQADLIARLSCIGPSMTLESLGDWL